MKQIGFGKFIKNPRRNQDCNDITTRDESLFFDLISTRTSLFHGQIQFELRQDAFKHIARDEIRRVSEKRNFHTARQLQFSSKDAYVSKCYPFVPFLYLAQWNAIVGQSR
jgi:hypothetical protein